MEDVEQGPSYTSPSPNPQPAAPTMPLPPLTDTVHTVVTVMAFDKESQNMTCPHCHADINTRVVPEANTKTHLLAVLLCSRRCWCCAPCLYYMDSYRAHRHYCPACSNFLGESKN